MPEQLKIDSERGIAEIVASAEVTIDQMKTSLKQIANAPGRGLLRGLLYDGRSITQAPNEDELFAFAKKTTESGKLKGMQLALLTSQTSALPYIHLALPIAQRGHYVKVFADRQAALEWLGDGHEKEGDS